MSLESKIENLTKAVEALTEQMAKSEPLSVEADPNAVQSKAKKPKPEAELKDETPQGPTVEELQDLAMSKVREDRSKKNAIKDLIASYDGAKVIGDVPSDKLADLGKKLEAL